MTSSTTATDADRPAGAALITRTRPKRPGALATSWTFAWRALLKIKHDPDQLYSSFILPIMFTLVFTFLFGGALAGSTGDYLQFLMPGILVMTVIMINMYTGISLNTDITKGIFDRFRGLSIWRPGILAGALLGDVLRYAIALVVVTVLGVLLGFRPAGGVLGVLGAFLFLQLFAFCLGWMWNAAGLVLKSPESVNQLSSMVLFPLVFASNVFVLPDTMPGWLAAVVNANPITHAVTTVRGLTAGDLTSGQLLGGLVACAALLVIFAPLSMYLFRAKSLR
ncbi:ABC transporter permease [Goodfellowiella coeruleoviolacea]|uniref:Transport permease protein n=1 Tax=Goodfellowiella coeruleoviolacea TaxID=334858 RepID=A0AAE3GHW7_9PSEU|nr:ABC transporter permease [Goodfellowiella coeruleoviolacea]MCP2167715.1 ABC-2 type transport system permease protein [Goodfellowiella coeruleoviolacea]